jgi:hypothetical protein
MNATITNTVTPRAFTGFNRPPPDRRVHGQIVAIQLHEAQVFGAQFDFAT